MTQTDMKVVVMVKSQRLVTANPIALQHGHVPQILYTVEIEAAPHHEEIEVERRLVNELAHQ